MRLFQQIKDLRLRILVAFPLVLGLIPSDSGNAQQVNKATQDRSVLDFESAPAGSFEKLVTPIGTWRNRQGTVLVDNKHGRSGKQCLQIAGGDNSSIELKLASPALANSELVFWAERWTSRQPFRFRVECKEGSEWKEIYNGDKKVRVGRAFLSMVRIPLGSEPTTLLRFQVSSPAGTGILIDDLKIAPAKPMKITSAEIVPLTLPALVGAKESALVKLKITTSGMLEPIRLRQLVGRLIGKNSASNTSGVKVYYGGSQANFSSNLMPFGLEQLSQFDSDIRFSGDQTLAEGDNYFWLVGQVSKDAAVGESIVAQITSISYSNGETNTFANSKSVQRIGVAVRQGGQDGVHTYRIPGLATTNEGTLIAVYDVRHQSGRDLPGDIDVGMSRSTDGGKTWEPMQTIMDMGSDPKWRGDGIGDPSILVDRKTGTIWVSATWSHGNRSWVGSGPGLKPEETGQWMLVKSEDDGVTWSDPINITSQVKRPEWCFVLQGPGKGITMTDGTLVFPAQYQDPPNQKDRQAHRLPHSTIIYSRDRGKTWKVGAGAWDDTTESQIVQLDSGELMINCRTNRFSKRAVLTTQDLGQSWAVHETHLNSLIEPRACMASLINVHHELSQRGLKSSRKKFLLFSNPDSLSGRNHITIKASLDSGKTWPTEKKLLLDEQTSAGYSCLTMIDPETVGILYEGSQAQMTFQRIKITDILSPPANQKTANPNLPVPKRAGPKTSGQLSVSRIFGDHMVLQANRKNRIWGKASPNAKVKVAFGGESFEVTANATGDWIAVMPPMQVSSKGRAIRVTANSNTIELRDVFVGEVWFCAGQSNMEWPLAKTKRGKLAIKKSSDNELRLFNFSPTARGGSEIYGPDQLVNLSSEKFAQGSWVVSNPENAGSFSAIAYYFAKRLREKLNCPIGVINVSAGGTPTESWIDAKVLVQHPTLRRLVDQPWLEDQDLEKWCQDRARLNLSRGLNEGLFVPGDSLGPNHSFKPGFMFASSIAPFENLSFQGIVWYQGESNANTVERVQQYDQLFPLLVSSWRQFFQNAELPVLYVQLPALNRLHWPLFRDVQRRHLSKLEHVGMATTMDVGHPTNVHPIQKQQVGERLAAAALSIAYHKNEIATGPVFERTTAAGQGKIMVEFSHVGDGLKTLGGDLPLHFEVAGEEKRFVSATAKIIGPNKIELTSSKVEKPMFVRYAWKPFPEPPVNLVNSAGFPASPFSSSHLLSQNQNADD